MTHLTRSCMMKSAPVNRPYKDLYIYYLGGRVDHHREALFGAGYIGNWQEDGTAFLFFHESADEKVNDLISGCPDLSLIDRYEMSYTDWHGGDIRPFDAGSLRVAPPWEQDDADCGRPVILLDPGVVFGAGNHPTTRDCMEALEMVYDRAPGSSALDLGTGTGLLALAAVRLGAPRVLAVDNNYLAVRTTRDNIRGNGLDDRVLAVQGRAEDFMESPADLLIANIHYDVMRRLMEAPGFPEKKWFILSGLLRTEARKIEDQVLRSGAEIVRTWVNDGVWHTFLGKSA